MAERDGRRDQIVGKVQERYGIAKDEAERAAALSLAHEKIDEIELRTGPALKVARDRAAIRADYYEALLSCEPAQKRYNAALAKARAALDEFKANVEAAAEIGGDFYEITEERTIDGFSSPALREISGSANDGWFR
jgi:hypothetical protein